ncbi:MAG: helix-turn-helix transcriptional regulator [Clostridia bacterium]|nr:helix-turn-helix transcriptional regulator [Clostridia bacterium]
MKLGEIIKKYREENNLSLREFADKCDLSHSYISKLEEGKDPRSGKKIEPTLDTVKKISEAINIPLDELLKMIGYIEPSIPETDPPIETIAAHHDGEDWTEEELEEIERFKEFVRMKRQQRERSE